MKSVVYTSTPKLTPAASSHAAIEPAKSTSAENTKLTKSTSAEVINLSKSTSTEDTTPAIPAGKAAAKAAAKAAHEFHTRVADKAAADKAPANKVDIETHGSAAGQSTTEVSIRSPEQPQEYIPAVRTASNAASSSAKQSTTSAAAGKQPLASNTEARVSYQLQPS